VDDDDALLELMEQTLSLAGGQIYTAINGPEGLKQFYIHQPDLVLLDIMMPGIDGFETCRLIRQSSNVPIIMLTALGREKDIVHAFNCGADDYISKPFLPNVLVVRIEAALRRAEAPPVSKEAPIYSDGYLTIDLEQRRVLVRGARIKLSAKEYKLLAYLFRQVGRVLTFNQILENVWGWEYRDRTDYVHVYVHHLREKLEEDPQNPKYLLTEYGVGYWFEKKETPPR
jgi:DNA-binding response OmpR family regulator